MANRVVRGYQSSPDLLFEAFRQAVVAAGYELQGVDPRIRTIYFKRGRTNMAGTVTDSGEGMSALSLVGAPGLHDGVAHHVEHLVAQVAAETRASTDNTALATDLERLGDLRERGLLSDVEYAEAKQFEELTAAAKQLPGPSQRYSRAALNALTACSPS